MFLYYHIVTLYCTRTSNDHSYEPSTSRTGRTGTLEKKDRLDSFSHSPCPSPVQLCAIKGIQSKIFTTFRNRCLLDGCMDGLLETFTDMNEDVTF